MDRDRSDMTRDDRSIPLAIVGLAFEFPQEATSVEGFWRMLCEGRSASTDFPPDRLNIDTFYHPDQSRPSSIPLRGGNFVQEDLGAFDAPFFSITPAEAACMDPQHRRMLETAYHALEDASIPLDKCSGSDTSVYTGCFTNDYLSIMQQDFEAEQRHAAIGIAPSMLANRLSWFFNFKGTSMNLDSACSSSLIALHLACQDLRAGTASMALVGGANLVYHPDFMKMMSNFNFLSPDSRCWSFDQRANGYARGEGTAVIVVKRLVDALRDGDMIRTVIRNTGSNQDGRTPGITQPSQEAQMNLIERTYKQADLDMEPTRFFEAHGTGTKVGDPIEANAIGRAFRHCRNANDPLYIGAVKSNIGHLEGCSGLAGIIKAILVLEKGVIPPIAGFESLNHRIDSERLHLHFPREVIPWPTSTVRRACVNSFGFGGTNAIAVLDDAYHYLKLNGLHGYHRTQMTPTVNKSTVMKTDSHSNQIPLDGITLNGTGTPNGESEHETFSKTPKLLVWSASEEAGVQELSGAYRDYVGRHAVQIDDLAYSLAARRSHLAWRSFAVTNPYNEATLEEVVPQKPVKAISDRRIAFVFTGQGAQYLGMGRQLVAFSVFRRSMESSEKCLEQLGCLWSLHNVIDGRIKDPPIDRPEYSQPLTTCLQLALVDLLKSFGIVPSVVLGHSSGEIAAAYAAGALSRFSAVKVAYHRGDLSSSVASNLNSLTMMAVGLSKEDALPYLDRLDRFDGVLNVAVGCVNSPKSVTLTGNVTQLITLEKWFKEDSIFARRLRVPIAYHSSFMKAIANDYHMAMGRLESGQRSEFVPMVSSVTRDVVTASNLSTPDYWVRNLTSTVEFEAAFSKILAQSNAKPRKQLGRNIRRDLRVTHVLEVGPHNALQGPIRECLRAFSAAKQPTYIPTLIRDLDPSIALLEAVGTLHCAGYPVKILQANCLEDSARSIPSDLPRYPFNHKQSYWKEGRLSQNFRFRKTARHDLLGTRSLDWNPRVAQWRNVIRLEELPWLEDHKIDGQAIFPAAGMVVMAMEALRQLVGDTARLGTIQIKDASFLHPINFPQGRDQAETQFILSTQSQVMSPTLWSHFRLFVIENNSYMECCSGFIRASANQQERNRMAPSVPFMGGKAPQDWIKVISESCQGPEKDPYKMSTGTAVQYGPSFQSLEHMRLGGEGEAIAEVSTDSWKLKDAKRFTQAYAVHPSTLDGLAQLLVPALSQGPIHLPTMIPTRVASIWVNCSNAEAFQRGKIRVAAKCKLRGYRGALADIIGTPIDSNSPLLYFEGLETTLISSTKSPNDKGVQPRNLCTRVVWKLDVDMMSHEQVLLECTRDRPKEPVDNVQRFKLLTITILSFVEEGIKFMEQHSSLSLDRHLEAYVGWMKYQQQRFYDGEISVPRATVLQLLNDHDAREQMISQVENSGVDSYFFMHIGRNLIKVLCGEIDPLDLMFTNGLADRYYEQMLANEHHAHPASAYIDLLCFKNPSMNILEVGAGTGGQTMRVLERLSSDGVKKWSRYDYTDISPGFFVQARDKFRDYADQMNFRVCDISKDPISQSFEAGSYDLVLASHVLHATDDLDQSLRNVRKLLKPTGKLLLFETTRPEALHVGFAFGLLKGWWSPIDHEPRSTHSPCLTPDQWDEHLRKTGFSGVDVDIPGQEELQCQYSSIIISSAVSCVNGASDTSQEVVLIRDTQVEAQCTTAKLLEARLTACFPACKTYTLAELAKTDLLESTIIIFLLEMNAILLDGISADDYDHFRLILIRYRNTIWVTKTNSGKSEPQHHLADGLGRTLMSEDSTRKFVTLTLDGLGLDIELTTNVIFELVKRVRESTIENLEINYVAMRGMIYIGRISENSSMNRRVAKGILSRQQEECHLTANTPLSLHLDSPGHLNTLEWMSCEIDKSPLEKDEVLVEVRSFGLTLKDYLVASGQLNELELGTECAGVVQAVGEQSNFRPGDRVCLVGTSTSRSTVCIKERAVIAIPLGMSFAEAASIPNALWLSYHALVNVARLQKGEIVLIHQGSSSVGQMTIQLARKLGADVLVTTSSASQDEFLCNELKVPTAAIFDSKDNSLSSKIYQTTHGRGVDVIVILFREESDAEFSECLAPFGRLVDINIRQHTKSITAPSENIAINTSRTSVNMVDLIKRKPVMAFETFQSAMKTGFEAQIRPPQPLHVFQADEIEAAFRHFQDADVIGKRVVELRPGKTIMANVETKPKYRFSADATYVIAGGLGGLGRSFARWMASRGARNLVLLSRTGVKGNAAKALVCELGMQGICVATPEVDIGDLSSLTHVFDNLAKSMAPIRGCIQATVALRDNLFENMTYEDWVISTRSKVTGSWNLHQVLPSDLDFFVLLSSVNGIFGGRAQANYAAGNTFKDALAHHRIAYGQRAVSIDLGLMVAEGVVAENEILLASMRRIGHLMDITQEELITLLDYYCDPSLPLLSDVDAQVLVGIEMPSAVLAKGIDLHHSIRRPMFRHLFQMVSEKIKAESCNADSAIVDRAAMLKKATSQDEAVALVTKWFSGKIGQILGLSELDIDPSKPVHTYGIDSLIAIDLKNWLAGEIGADIEVFALLGNMSLEMVSAVAAEKSRYRSCVSVEQV